MNKRGKLQWAHVSPLCVGEIPKQVFTVKWLPLIYINQIDGL